MSAPMQHESRTAAGGPPARAGLVVEASLTLVAMLFAFLALDDITTDNATTGFVPEYTLLGIAGAWLLIFVVRLGRKHRFVPAAVSLLLLVAAAWVAANGIGHKNAGGWSVFWPDYSVITTAWLWFTAISVRLPQAFRGAGPADASR
jgi:hypothetical protein